MLNRGRNMTARMERGITHMVFTLEAGIGRVDVGCC